MSFLGFTKEDGKRTWQLLRMNLKKRYMGSKLGLVWAIVGPLLLMMVYLVVFGFVMQSRAPGSEISLDYVLWFICGFGPWLAISEALSGTAQSVIGGVQIVKTFPIKSELLPISSAMMGLPQIAVSMVIVFVLLFVNGFGVMPYALWLIVCIPLLFAFLAGLGFFLSAFCVFVRDAVQIIPTVLVCLMFFTPIFYQLDQLPMFVQKINFLNPFYQIVAPIRSVLIDQQPPDWFGLVYVLALTAILWFFGLKYFRRLKGYFESAL